VRADGVAIKAWEYPTGLNYSSQAVNLNLVILSSNDMGVAGTVLLWFKSYLTGHIQVVSYAGETPSSRPMICGVLQGSVLDPLLFYIYTRPLEQIIQQRNRNCQFYADDALLYVLFDPFEAYSADSKRHG